MFSKFGKILKILKFFQDSSFFKNDLLTPPSTLGSYAWITNYFGELYPIICAHLASEIKFFNIKTVVSHRILGFQKLEKS